MKAIYKGAVWPEIYNKQGIYADSSLAESIDGYNSFVITNSDGSITTIYCEQEELEFI